MRTNAGQILHAPVTADNIVEKLWLQHKIQLAKDQLDLEAPISQLGTFSVPVKLEDIDVPLKVRVQAR
jgi:ribosomal protein L9